LSQRHDRLLQPFGKWVEAIFRVPLGKGLDGRLTNRAVTGAAAKVATELVVQLVRMTKLVAVIAFEQREDKPRRAITTLGTVALDHRLLDRVQPMVAGDTL